MPVLVPGEGFTAAGKPAGTTHTPVLRSESVGPLSAVPRVPYYQLSRLLGSFDTGPPHRPALPNTGLCH